MKEKFVDAVTKFITKRKKCTDKEIKTIRYGLEGLYSLVTKMLVIAVITIALNTFVEFLILLFAYALVRAYSFGMHASKSWACWATTLPIYVIGSLIIKYSYINSYVIYIIWILAFFSFVFWAPADTPKRPLIRAKQRHIQKVKTCLITILYLFIIILINNRVIVNSLTVSLFLQALMVNPVVYMITKTPFNNYKSYPNKV